ncbi:hypothetical protein DBV15_11819 [Temnothorax longispinosus]|uniref:Uncharacterized protein n=1 Tax=Temnothorax longispinosus TaxID=300112 RepID=A0A4S2KMA8_9HYME|nr:hypothetical protein DBV15_11819 [Temnothorax longispinosus]
MAAIATELRDGGNTRGRELCIFCLILRKCLRYDQRGLFELARKIHFVVGTISGFCHKHFVKSVNSGSITSNQLISVPSTSNQSNSVPSTSSQSVSLPSAGLTYLPNAKLPFIKIPQFDGNAEKWLTFKNLFYSMIVTSPTLSAVEKLQYLKTHLSGSAFNLVQHTALTTENFQKTWDALIEFYENTRLLINSTLQSLLNIKRVTKESGTELQQLYSEVMQLYRIFEMLECPIEHWDHILIFICTQKLDLESSKLWEAHLGSSRKAPSWKQFCEFLFARMSSLQSFKSSQQKRSLQSTKQFSAKVHHQGKSIDASFNQKGGCILCKERHFISFCPRYVSKTTQQKLAFVSTHKLCYNCLGLHRVSQCRITKRCQKCGRKHHTSIHSADFSKSKGKENNNNRQEPSSDTSSKQNALGQSRKLRALVDQGSEVAIITERVVQQFNLHRANSAVLLTGIGANNNKTKGITSFLLKPHFSSEFEVHKLIFYRN